MVEAVVILIVHNKQVYQVVQVVAQVGKQEQVEQEILPPLLLLKVITVGQELLLLLIKVDQAVEQLELEQL